MTFQDILKIFEENDNFLILTHKSPDGDTLGSGFGLCAFLRDMGKKANVVNSDSFPERYDLIYEGYYPQEFDVKYVIAVISQTQIFLAATFQSMPRRVRSTFASTTTSQTSILQSSHM